MSIRLLKVAKELNVGTSTIVDHLQNKGFDIDNNPRTKLTPEMYDVLKSEFQNSVAIKEQADSLMIGNNRKKKEEEEAERARLEKRKQEAANKKAQEEAESTPEPEVKPEPEAKPEPEVKVEPEVKAEPEPTVTEESVKAPKLQGPKIVDKIDLDPPKKKPAVKEEPKEKPVEQKAKPVEEKAKPVEAKKTDEEKPKTPATPEDNTFRAETPQLKGTKLLGKIDTDKPKKPESNKPVLHRAQKVTLAGTKVVGKIKLPEKKTTTNTNTNDNKKRKRKRKKVVPQNNSGSQGNRGGGNNSGSGRGRRDNNSNKGGRKQPDVQEISKKEVEAKIKATMAKMAGKGKNKRSKIRREERSKKREKLEQEEQATAVERAKLQLTEFISVSELANLMDVSATQVITTCMGLGVIVAINQRLDAEVIELVADEYGHEVNFISAEDIMDIEEEEVADDPADLVPRAPIITVMGHVDHGKTSLLDYIRNTNVIDAEAGGITQHIGAYEVVVGDEKRKITFLDTPGHEAFTAMRARGAKITDVAVIIVSADDNVMPQTKEAISHAQAAGVPIIFAINKIDKLGADPERIKGELAQMNLQVEDWGGKYQSTDISAKHGTNVENLLEQILLQAELLELKANPDKLATGVVLEASLDKGRGYLVKVLVQGGTLKIGDPLVAGAHFGKVKALVDATGSRVKSVGPSQPVMVLGLKGAPQAGEKFKVMDNEQEARQLATKRAQIYNEQIQRTTKRLSLKEIGRRLALGSFKELNLIVKGDVDGSIEALSDSLIKKSTETVQVNIVHKAVGQIIESDVLLASASDAIIIGFQVRPSAGARKLAEREGVQIKTYSIIYDAIEEIKLAIEGMLDTIKEEKVVCSLTVQEVYKISKVGTIAGCIVTEGKINRNTKIRIVRNGIVVYPTKEGVQAELGSLKRFKDDVKEVKNGMECGVTIKNFNDIKVDDVIEGYEIIEIKQKLA